jgi:hypothetical protein
MSRTQCAVCIAGWTDAELTHQFGLTEAEVLGATAAESQFWLRALCASVVLHVWAFAKMSFAMLRVKSTQTFVTSLGAQLT